MYHSAASELMRCVFVGFAVAHEARCQCQSTHKSLAHTAHYVSTYLPPNRFAVDRNCYTHLIKYHMHSSTHTHTPWWPNDCSSSTNREYLLLPQIISWHALSLSVWWLKMANIKGGIRIMYTYDYFICSKRDCVLGVCALSCCCCCYFIGCEWEQNATRNRIDAYIPWWHWKKPELQDFFRVSISTII